MKKIFIAASLCLFLSACGNKTQSTQTTPTDSTEVTDMHNAENSLDIEGTYAGTLPAADCPGIKTTLTLNSDRTFTLISDYIDRKDATYTEKGSYALKDNLLTLTFENDQQYYKVGENTLTRLNRDKQEITGDLAPYYILQKQ